MLERIYARVMKWLARHGMLRNPDDADASNAPPELSSAEALTTAGMQRGTLLTVRESGDGAGQDDPAIAPTPPPRVTDAVTYERFNLHASVHLHAHDELGRERLCRYLTRPVFSLARLRVRRPANVSYRVKKATRGRVTERVMTPVETLARLAAIVPPPRYPLLRFHGVVAPRHRWRDRVVPRPEARVRACKGKPQELASEETTVAATTTTTTRPSRETGDGRAAFTLDVPLLATASLTTSGLAEHLAPHVLSIAHGHRILEGELYASSSRLAWRTLLKRTFEVDLRACVRCGGKLTVRAVLTEPAVIAKMLDALRRAPRPPPPEPPPPTRRAIRRAWPSLRVVRSTRHRLSALPGNPLAPRARSPPARALLRTYWPTTDYSRGAASPRCSEPRPIAPRKLMGSWAWIHVRKIAGVL